MSEEKKPGRRPPRKDGARRKPRSSGYIHKSPAVCVVVHDPSGKTMPDEDATAIVNSIFEIAAKKGYLINFTRT